MKKRAYNVSLVIVLVFLLLGAYFLVQIRKTPDANPIYDVFNISGASGSLQVKSVKMSPPRDRSVRSLFGKSYTSTLTLDVANTSEQNLYLGLEYYADSGSMGPYSPGASSLAQIVMVPPKWEGPLNFPIRHPRFVKGGYVALTLAICDTDKPDGIHLPRSSETIFHKKYVLIPANKG